MRKLLFLFLILTAGLFFSCSTEVTLTLQEDDSLDIRFEGGAGAAFARMISSAAGMSSGEEDGLVIDTASVSYELARAGFSDVKVNQKKGGAVSISMQDKKQTSYLFTSKIIKSEKNKIIASITRKSLEDFYSFADEQTRMILDLFLAPVFNDENMSEAEYLEMLASFYGEGAAKEVEESLVIINLVDKEGKKETLRLPLIQLMCGSFNY